MIDTIIKQRRISFLIDGADFSEKIISCTAREFEDTIETVYILEGGLRLTNKIRRYKEYNACDMVNEWENISDENSKVISELWDSDVEIPFPRSEPKALGRAYLPREENAVKVYAPSGSNWSAAEFYCDVDRLSSNRYENWLLPGMKNKYSSTGGRSSETSRAPFFNIAHGKERVGVIAAVGWTGQWNAEIERREESVIFRSKIEDTAFYLMPGEMIRTSSVTFMAYEGSFADGQNAWRRFVKNVYSPIGKLEVPEYAPFCAGLWGGMSTEGCLHRIRTVESEALPFDHYWMDAGWYGAGELRSPDEYEGDWSQHTGNWEVNRARHPDLLEDVAAEIKKSGKRFILWFEPERVRSNAPIFSEHPEYFISIPTNKVDNLLDLGNEDAWQYCFDTISGIIERLNVSVYRQDFNFSPLNYWRSKNTEGRVGITEIKHINGLYRLWDALIAKFPYLLIDNCASGGRRIDIETLRRSVPLWRSDAQCPADPMPEMAQAHSLCHGSWMPYSGTGVGRVWFDTYRFRSTYSPALTTNFTFSENNSFGDDKEAMAWLLGMCREYLRVRPYLSEDIYPLTEPSGSLQVWSAVQYHDREENAGVVQVFRREKSPYEEASFKLFGLSSDAEYVFEDMDGGELSFLGSDLLSKGLKLKIEDRRCAKVYLYKMK